MKRKEYCGMYREEKIGIMMCHWDNFLETFSAYYTHSTADDNIFCVKNIVYILYYVVK